MSKAPNIFQQVQLVKPKRSKFDLSHERKMSIPFGALIPTMVTEVLPGDSFRVKSNTLVRFQAMLAPVMHRVNVYTHYFYVPYRVLTRDFTRFINYQGNRPNFSTAASFLPYFQPNVAQNANVYGVGAAVKDGSLLDYLGFPTAPNDAPLTAGSANYVALRVNALLPLAYQRIWSDWYRDQNFTRPLFSEDGDGQAAATNSNYFDNTLVFDTTVIPDPERWEPATNSQRIIELLKLRWRAWEKDYLTSALPYANQGIGDPRVPINVPAGALGNTPAVGTPVPSAAAEFGRTGGIQYPGTLNNPSDQGGFTISALRIASALKRWLENSARGGSRYVESLWHHWFVKSSDGRLTRAEYLGGGMQPVVISEVVTQAPATAEQVGVPPGYLAGHGIAYGSSNQFTRSFEEHGVVMAITSVLPRTSYLYSMPRAFMRMEPLDFAWPEFAQIGEQPILGSEVVFKIPTSGGSASVPSYAATQPADSYYGFVTRFPMGYTGASYVGFDLQNDDPEISSTAWGFQSRYAEYKYIPDTVHGLFRNNLSFWHFGRILPASVNAPALNNAFVTSNPRMDNFAVLPSNGSVGQYNQHPILLQVYNQVSVVRSLPYFNTPSLW